MTEAGLKSYLISIVLFGMIVAGGLHMIGSLIIADNTYIQSNNEHLQEFSAFNISEEGTLIGTNLLDETTSIDGDGGGDGSFWDSFIGGSASVVQTIPASIGFMNTMFSATTTIFGIPGFIVGGVIAIIGIILAFAIIKAVTGRDMD